MSTIVVPALNRLKLGRMLCQFRERSGLTQELAAADLDMSDSSLSRNEKGQIAPHPLAVRAMLELYYVPRDGWDDVLELAREAKRGAWWQVLGISAQAYVALESEAIAIRNFELAFIPGLLQTEEYACEVFTLDDARRRSRGMRSAFNVLSFPPDTIDDVGYVDHAAGSLQISKVGPVQALCQQFHTLSKPALSENDSLKLITDLADTLAT